MQSMDTMFSQKEFMEKKYQLLNQEFNQEYEQISDELVRQNKKFSFQEKANSFIHSYQSTTQSNFTQSTLASSGYLSNSLKGSNNCSTLQDFNQQLVSIHQDQQQFQKSSNILKQWCLIQEQNRPNIKLCGISQVIGQGAQGKVTIDFMSIDQLDLREITGEIDKTKLVPVALKFIPDSDQFKREVLIMKQLSYDYLPRLINCDVDNQIICMELCICTLEEFSMIEDNPYIKSDNFTASLLLRLMTRIVELMKLSCIHGDIKPQNTALTIRNDQVELVLIDFGASSNHISDYCNYYTQAYCNQKVLQKVLNEEILDIDTVLFNELFSAVRTVQYLILKDKKSELFQQKNIENFITKYKQQYPNTTDIIQQFFKNPTLSFSFNQFSQLISNYSTILPDSFSIDMNYLFSNLRIFKV